MIIKHISLRNFGCIRTFDRDFGKGIFIFAGDNGNGKTTVFKAVVLALFDSYEGSIVDYINWESEEFDVSIDFEHLGYAYNVNIHQSVKSKTSDREVTDFHNNQKYIGQEAKDFLKKIFDVELIKAAMLSLEQQIDVVTVKPSERRDYLKKIYDLEFKRQQMFFSESLTALAIKTTEISTELNILRNKEYKDIIIPELPMSESEYAAMQTGYAEDIERMGKLKAELERYETVKKTITDLENEVTRLSGEIIGVEGRMREAESRIAALPEKSGEKIAKAKIDIEQAESELAGLKNPDPAIQAIESKIAAIHLVRVGSINTDALTAAQVELSKMGQKIEALEGVCPTCNRPYDKTPETEKELAECKIQKSELERKLADLSKENERITKLQKENQENKERKADLEHEKQLLVERRDSRKQSLEASLSAAKQVLESEKGNLEQLLSSEKSALDEMRKMLEAKKSSKTAAEKRFAGAKAETVKNPGDELVIVQHEIAERKSRIDNYQKILTEREAMIKQKEQERQRRENEAKRIKILDTELQEKSREVAELETCTKILKNEFPVYVISRIVKDLEISMNDFLRKTYGGRYTVRLEDKKNALRMVYGPKNADAGIASGYEKSIFSMAWKWALSKVQNNRTLMMDEVDSAASQKSSLIFYKTIGDSVKLFDQILIVSHKEQTRELLENEYNAQVLTFSEGVAV
jgi:DNA repair exonuclease SbcCD ATPase subunit